MGEAKADHAAVVDAGPEVAHRHELLLKMYDQLFNDINRHILTVWHTVGTVGGAVALLGLVEKGFVSMDVAVAAILLTCAWSVAHCYDSAYWYNRNLIILSNIERQFLKSSDLHDIHYYFGEHRASNQMLTHLRIQLMFALSLGCLAIACHLLVRVIPGLSQPLTHLEIQRALPYATAVPAAWWLETLRRGRREAYGEMLVNSPGLPVDTTGVTYGVGHPATSKVPRA